MRKMEYWRLREKSHQKITRQLHLEGYTYLFHCHSCGSLFLRFIQITKLKRTATWQLPNLHVFFEAKKPVLLGKVYLSSFRM